MMTNNKSKKETVGIIKQVELKYISIKLQSDGIMRFDLKPCDDFSVSDLMETNAAAAVLGEGKSYPRLTIINNFTNFGKEVREYGATEESNATTTAAAFVVNLAALKFIGNFYISFNKPVRPTKIFDSEEEAVEWLKNFL